MSFEEQFPSLKMVGCDGFTDDDGENYVYMDEKWFSEFDLQQNCLDKQKVRDAIDKHSKIFLGKERLINQKQLLKELGL